MSLPGFECGRGLVPGLRLPWALLVALTITVGCGCSDGKLAAGTYVLSGVNVVRDDCNVMKGKVADGGEIDVTVAGGDVAVYMARDLTPPRGAFFGGAFTAWSAKDADMIPGTNCRDMWVKKLTGTVVRKGKFTGVYEFSDRAVSGSDCADEAKIGFRPPMCTSVVTFTATKK